MANGVTMVVHYPKSDREMWGDYYDVTIDVTLDTKTYHQEYGDHYHEKGVSKAEGFVDALRLIYGSKFPAIRYNVADRDDL